ncbi:hypothetical protein [Atopobium fossor]|uniref:hypothetical protein n=1 Tax=Atopobium fossor TaxID=39487 RepID=UPI000425D3E3|nr:hypothetical protein [Atopobium fossor]
MDFGKGIATLIFILLVWLAGTISQYLYWKKVRVLIHEYAKNHEGYLGTGMCKISFSRKVFVLVLTDFDFKITGCYELASLSLNPSFSPIREVIGFTVDSAIEKLPNPKYADAFKQAFHAIKSSKKS